MGYCFDDGGFVGDVCFDEDGAVVLAPAVDNVDVLVVMPGSDELGWGAGIKLARCDGLPDSIGVGVETEFVLADDREQVG